MTIQDLGSLGELIAAVATVATLAYLAVQIRQNTNELRTASIRDSSTNQNKWLDVLHLPGVRHAFSVGLRNYPDMPADQKGKFAYVFDNHHNSLLIAFALHQSGALSEFNFESHLTGYACQIATPGGQSYWADCKIHYNPALVDRLERRLREGNLPDILKNPHFQLDETPARSKSDSYS